MLAGVLMDIDFEGYRLRVEAEWRLARSWKLEGELQIWNNIDQEDPIFDLRRDDYLQLELAWYF